MYTKVYEGIRRYTKVYESIRRYVERVGVVGMLACWRVACWRVGVLGVLGYSACWLAACRVAGWPVRVGPRRSVPCWFLGVLVVRAVLPTSLILELSSQYKSGDERGHPEIGLRVNVF